MEKGLFMATMGNLVGPLFIYSHVLVQLFYAFFKLQASQKLCDIGQAALLSLLVS